MGVRNLRKRIQELERKLISGWITLKLRTGGMAQIPDNCLLNVLSGMMQAYQPYPEAREDGVLPAEAIRNVPYLAEILAAEDSDEEGHLIELIQAIFDSPSLAEPVQQ